ncbi:hypothetical protein ACFV4E_15180 [Streptomyces hygroscopicus]
MAQQPEGRCRDCSKRDRPHRWARWLGPVYTLYRIVKDHWPD